MINMPTEIGIGDHITNINLALQPISPSHYFWMFQKMICLSNHPSHLPQYVMTSCHKAALSPKKILRRGPHTVLIFSVSKPPPNPNAHRSNKISTFLPRQYHVI